MLIKKAIKADAQEILDLQKLAYLSEAGIYNDFTIQPLHQGLDEITSEIESQYVLKCVVNDKIVGSVRAYMSEGTCFINKLIVHPEFQNQGIGTKLLKEIENEFVHAKRFELFTGYKSRKNLHIYHRFGFEIFKQEKISEALTLVFLEKSRNRINNAENLSS
ncbi:MAG: GNAT family N-acetyltransferase [Desulfobacteraceae bacterium]|jgi:ribosomal protein S18 acetylase RimI-like enzyme